jgi:microcystin-dependent protein
MDAFIATILLFAGNFAPRGWALCQGQLLSIAQNTALFSLVGVSYGGDGRVTFGLPDLQGRTAIGWGQGQGLSNRIIGERAGTETHTLITSEMPTHAHNVTIPALSTPGTVSVPASNTFLAQVADNRGTTFNGYGTGTPNVGMNAGPTSVVGGNAPHNNMQPYLAITYVIALEGIYPSRN